MKNARVGILGYGVIGKRVADAVRRQPDMTLAGIAGPSGSRSMEIARRLGYATYTATDDVQAPVALGDSGRLVELLAKVDVLLDCTPSGMPEIYRQLYACQENLTVIVQGGEKHSFGGVSFNSFANYRESIGQKRIRVISCSSTGSTRILWALQRAFGVSQGFISLWRRAADPGKARRTALNALAPSLGQSHHAPDVLTVMPELSLFSFSADCPTTISHVLTLQVDLERETSVEEIRHVLSTVPRIIVGDGLATTADLAEYYRNLKRPRGDRPEVFVWSKGLLLERRSLVVSCSIHMESITIPETIDCVRASLGLEVNPWVSIYQTDIALGIAKDHACYRNPFA
jgi:glyceraldehyde-3-phosphate dehydrogenase (NAD(P))